MADYIAALWAHWLALMTGIVTLLAGAAIRAIRRFKRGDTDAASALIADASGRIPEIKRHHQYLHEIPDWIFIVVGILCMFHWCPVKYFVRSDNRPNYQ